MSDPLGEYPTAVLADLLEKCRSNREAGKYQDRGIAMSCIPEDKAKWAELFDAFDLSDRTFGVTLKSAGSLEAFTVQVLWNFLGSCAQQAFRLIDAEANHAPGA